MPEMLYFAIDGSGYLLYLLPSVNEIDSVPLFNSILFRVPPGLKRLYSPSLLALEPVINKLAGKFLSLYVICRWRKKGEVPGVSASAGSGG